MTDIELLELAAKAAGIEVHRGNDWQSNMLFRSIERPNSPLVANVHWDPLADDGDALRLAVKLVIDICPPRTEDDDALAVDQHSNRSQEPQNRDPYVATRRAIVRAAAAIGGEHD